MVPGTGWLVVVALAVTMATWPVAAGDHCDTKIHVYGRIALAPLASPPYVSATSSICVRVFGDGAGDHLLPPNTDEVRVRVHVDFGPSVPTLRATLTGLGFVADEQVLARTLYPFGNHSYDSAWVPLPNGTTDGALEAAVEFPGKQVRSVTYHTTATIALPS